MKLRNIISVVLILAFLPTAGSARATGSSPFFISPRDAESPVTLSINGIEEVNGTTRVTRAAIHFRWNKSDYDDEYLNNAEAVTLFTELIKYAGQENIESVDVVSYASPDGVYEHNMRLCRERAESFSKILHSRSGITVPVNISVGGEAWDMLRDMVTEDNNLSASSRKRILNILDNSNIGNDTKKWRFAHNYLGKDDKLGDVYRHMLTHYYRYLRCLDIKIDYKDTPQKQEENLAPEPEDEPEQLTPPQTEEAEEAVAPPVIDAVPEPSTTVIPLVKKLRKPIIGVSTNLPYDITYVPQYGLTSIPSFSVEYYPATGIYTFGADVEWPMWQHPDEHRYMQINNITLWARRYFKPGIGRYYGPYLLGSVNAVRYGIGFDAEKGWEGEGAGASVGGGFKFYLGKYIYVDAGASLGALYSAYDPYSWGNDATLRYYYDYFGDPDEFQRRNKRLFWFGPTRVFISIGIDLFNRRK